MEIVCCSNLYFMNKFLVVEQYDLTVVCPGTSTKTTHDGGYYFRIFSKRSMAENKKKKYFIVSSG